MTINIKQISLLSLMFIASINAGPRTEEVDAAKHAFNECENSRGDCIVQKNRFDKALNEFVEPHRENVKNRQEEYDQFIDRRLTGELTASQIEDKKKEDLHAMLKIEGHECIARLTDKENKKYFLYSTESIIEFCDSRIDITLNILRNGTYTGCNKNDILIDPMDPFKASCPENTMKTKRFLAPADLPAIEPAKKELKDMIRAQ